MMTRSVDLAPLDRIGWLAEQPEAFRAWVATAGSWRTLEAGRLLYDAGDDPEGLHGLAEGSLDVTFPLVIDEPVSLHRAETGFWLGDLALLAGAPRLVSVRVRRRARVLSVPASRMIAHLQEHPEHWRCFYALTYRNMAMALSLLSEALVLPPTARVARRLLLLADANGTVALTQEELAGLVGVTRATVRRALHLMIEEGAVTTGYGALHIANRAAVQRRAGGV